MSSSDSDKGEKKPEVMDKIKPPNLSVLMCSRPNNIVSGTVAGIGNTIGGALTGLVIIIAAPIKCGIDGYNSHGILGCAGGILGGVLMGVAVGASVAVYGALACLWQVTLGLIRTPQAVIAATTGQDWDIDLEEFAYYDLTADAAKTLSMTDADFTSQLKSKKSIARVLSTSNECIASPIKRKEVRERVLYDALGVEPEASQAEIKKGYYLQARKNHPDRKPNDPKAHANFQRIGEAYQVLSDPKLRDAYDSRGQDAVDAAPKMDAGAIYAMLFGSELFESIIGELQSATTVKGMIEPDENASSDFSAFKQRKREVLLAVTLVTKLSSYTPTDKVSFTERIVAETKELSESPLGGALLSLIGGVYLSRARADANTLVGVGLAVKHSGEMVFDAFSTIGSVTQVVFSGWEFMRLQQKAEEAQKVEDDRLGTPQDVRDARTAMNKSNMNMGPPESATDSEKQQFREKTKAMSSHMLAIAWQVTKSDIVHTLCSVCNKILHDHSISPSTRLLRREALLILGKEYSRAGATVDLGLSDLLERMGMQSGLFGPDPVPPSPTVPEARGASYSSASESTSPGMFSGMFGVDGSTFFSANKEEHKEPEEEEEKKKQWEVKKEKDVERDRENVKHWFNTIKETLLQVPNYSVKELKEKIELYSSVKRIQDPGYFLEKQEMRKTLIEIIFDILGAEEIIQLNLEIYEFFGEEVVPYDRSTLMARILMQN